MKTKLDPLDVALRKSASVYHRRLYNRQQRDAADIPANDRAGRNQHDIMTDRLSELEARICTGRWTAASVVRPPRGAV